MYKSLLLVFEPISNIKLSNNNIENDGVNKLYINEIVSFEQVMD
jgi:hypothetical protein